MAPALSWSAELWSGISSVGAPSVISLHVGLENMKSCGPGLSFGPQDHREGRCLWFRETNNPSFGKKNYDPPLFSFHFFNVGGSVILFSTNEIVGAKKLNL